MIQLHVTICFFFWLCDCQKVKMVKKKRKKYLISILFWDKCTVLGLKCEARRGVVLLKSETSQT